MLESISPKRIGWEPFIHLIWLLFLVFQPLFDPDAGAGDWWLIALIVTLFLPVYFWTWSQKTQQVLWGIAAMSLLGLLFSPVNSGATGMFIYAAAALGAKVRPGLALKLIGAIVGLVCVSALLSNIPWPYRLGNFLPILLMTFLIGGLNLYYAARSRANVRLQLAEEEIEHLATIAERERIARDLHDLLGHTLSVITLKTELAHKLIDKDVNGARQEMEEVERISREALSEVRAAVSGYRAKGFMAEVASAKLALEAAGVSFAFQGDAACLSPLQESALSLVLREAITNVIRHAAATRCAVVLHCEEAEVRLEVTDNGKGLNGVLGSGLSGIRERIQAFGGQLTLTSLGGTQLLVTLPALNQVVTSATKPLRAQTLVEQVQ